MSSTPATRKKTRSMSRSMGSNNSTPKITNDSNLNGENDSVKKNVEAMEIDKSTENNLETDPKSTEESSISTETKPEKPTKGRKRKGSELKLSNSISEELPAKDKPVPESEDELGKSSNATAVVTMAPEVIQSPIKDKADADAGTSKESPTVNDNSAETPTNETDLFGKGKRARIPNKRYSDFPLKTPTKISFFESELQSNLENGLIKENIDSGSNTDASENSGSIAGSPSLVSGKATRASTSSSPAITSHKKKTNVDLSNPNYLKPFQYGWKRELVYRATLDSNLGKRNGDIYYYTPSGRKVRSMREVSEHLKNKDLTLDDFTFTKEPLGLDDPEKEIIRDAKNKSGPATPLVKKLTPKVTKTPKATTSQKMDAVPSTSQQAEAEITSKEAEFKRVPPPRVSSGGFKVKLTKGTSAKKPEKKTKDDAEDNLEVGTYPPWTPTKKTPNKVEKNLADGNKLSPCSIRCQGVSGIIPSLQCRLCVCLYHHECVGLTSKSNVPGYVCKNCDPNQWTESSATAVAPPPLTRINDLQSVNAKSTTLPKLQPIPKYDNADQPEVRPFSAAKERPVDNSELQCLTSRPTLPEDGSKNTTTTASQSESQRIVDSITTWLPPSSTIQLSGNKPVADLEYPQYVEIIGNKKYVVIPKCSIMSVSPLENSTATPSGGDVSSNATADGSANFNLDSANMESSNVKMVPDGNSKSKENAMEVNDATCQNGEHGGHGLDTNKRNLEIAKESQIGKRKQLVTTAKKRKRNSKSVPLETESESVEITSNSTSYLQNVAFGYSTLLYVFQYLKVQDLLHATCVCTMWRDIASHPLLWKTVRMKNSQIHNFEGLCNALSKNGTVHLDLRKMLLPPNNNENLWAQFSKEITKVSTLKQIELCRCPAAVIEEIAISNPQLEVISAVTIKCESISLAPLICLKNLQDLRLKSTTGFSLNSDLSALAELKKLQHLSLTSVKDLNKLNIEVIAGLTNLESLDLGECADFPRTFGSDILARLTKLEKLRLEKGQGNCYTFEILEAVKEMPHIEQLELVNFDIKSGFDKALGACKNIKKLLVIPTYISQSATTNHMVLGGVLRLQSNLSHFVWGITLELLRVTELFVDQCEDADKKEKKERKPPNGDSIPVLKPVPLLKEGTSFEIPPAQDPPQVEILPLPNLQKLLLQSLPTTRVKILKIPFHATWRQSITDTVN